MRITESGNVGFGSAARLYLDGVTASGDTYLAESSANVLDMYTGGVNALKLTATTATFAAGPVRVGPLATDFSITNGSAVSLTGSGTGLAGNGTNLVLGVWNGPMTFQAGNDGENLVSRMTITSAGNVGIASTTPFAMLGVENTGSGLSFAVNDAAGDASPFVIDAAGNVGVGIVNPTSTLAISLGRGGASNSISMLD